MHHEQPTIISRIAHNEFLTIVQLHPPEVEKLDAFATTVDKLEQEEGITLFDINATPDAQRMDSFAVAAKLAKPNRIVMPHATARVPLEQTIKHVTDGYEKHNINHILVIKGDPPEDGNFPTTVSDIMTNLTQLRKKDNKKLIFSGAVNQNAVNLDAEGTRLQEKIDQGVDFFMSQLVFDREQAQKLHSFYKKYTSKPLIMGISALKKIGDNKGIVIPEAVQHEDEETKIKRTADLVTFIKEEKLAQGIYIAASLNYPELVIPTLRSVAF